MRHRAPLRALGPALVLAVLAGRAPSALGSDSCSSPEPITELPSSLTLPLDGATPGPGDVAPPCWAGATRATVWLSLELPDETQVRLDTSRSTDNSVITVLTGACGSLVPVTCDDNSGINGERNHGLVDFRAEAGVRYLVQVSSPFEPESPGSEVVVDASVGVSGPLDVTVTNEAGTPLPGAHVQVRDTLGGFYLLREKWTGPDGTARLHVAEPGEYSVQALVNGRQPAVEIVDVVPSGTTADLALPKIEAVPQAPDDVARIVFARTEKLVHFRPDGTDEREILIESFSSVRYPAWSPDGTKIAFEGKYLGPSPRNYEIWIVNADGTDLHRHSSFEGSPGRQLDLSWSPDGEWLLFDSPDPDAIASSILYRTSATVPGPAEIVARPGSRGRYSPDGSLIAFDAFASLRVMRADGTNEAVVHGQLAGNPSWSPDASRLVVASALGITTIGLDGTGLTVVAEPRSGAGAYHPAWSPAGREILFMDEYLSEWLFAMVSVDGTDRRIIRREGATGSVPDWSPAPTGALTGDVPGDDSPTADLLDPDGGERLEPGAPFEITWRASDDFAVVSQDLWEVDARDQRRLRPIALDLPGGVRSHAWEPEPGDWSRNVRVQLVVRDGGGQDAVDVSRYSFAVSTLDQPYYRVQVTHPEGGETFATGDTVTITWEADSFFTLPEPTVEISYDDGRTFEIIDWGLPRETRTLEWTVPDVVTDEAVVRVLQGNWSESRKFGINASVSEPDPDPEPPTRLAPETGLRVLGRADVAPSSPRLPGLE